MDEAYIQFPEQPSMMLLIARFPNLVVMRTLAKVYGMANVRCGFTMGHLKVSARLKQFAGTPELSVLAAVAGIASPAQLGLITQR